MARPEAIKPGYFVAISLVPGTAPDCCYIGLVLAADEYGLRINMVEWDNELDRIKKDTQDLFIPWININSMLVYTEEEPVGRFVRDRAPAWKKQVAAMEAGG